MPGINYIASVAFIAGLGAAPALGAAWQLVDTSSNAQIEVDLGSAVRKDGMVTGWVQSTYAKKTSSKSGDFFVYRTMKEQVRLDCRQQTSTILVRGYFDDDGSEIAVIKGTGSPRAVMPDTPEQRVLSGLCNPAADARTARARPAAARAAAPNAVDARYMDGPAPTARKAGLILAKSDATVPPAAAAIAKPAVKEEPKVEAKAVEKAESKPAEKHAPAVAHAKTAPHAAAKADETREMVVARVMKARAGAPLPPETRARTAHAGAAATAGAAHTHSAHWDYEGEYAPYRWGDMKAEYGACKAGARQSPIDIRNPVVSEVEPIQFFYEDVPLKVTNNGHTIQVDYAAGSFILFGGVRYELLQFHFHTPSEERINGRSFDMVAHLVHRSAQGRLAVVAVLLTAGREQAMLQPVWNAMPGARDRTRERVDVAINVRQLLPSDTTYYSYMGSLTTPPCTEGVQWLVMKTPVEISREQIAHFTALYPMNARPLQALNDRLIKVGR